MGSLRVALGWCLDPPDSLVEWLGSHGIAADFEGHALAEALRKVPRQKRSDMHTYLCISNLLYIYI